METKLVRSSPWTRAMVPRKLPAWKCFQTASHLLVLILKADSLNTLSQSDSGFRAALYQPLRVYEHLGFNATLQFSHTSSAADSVVIQGHSGPLWAKHDQTTWLGSSSMAKATAVMADRGLSTSQDCALAAEVESWALGQGPVSSHLIRQDALSHLWKLTTEGFSPVGPASTIEAV